jgi:hypothetical protein
MAVLGDDHCLDNCGTTLADFADRSLGIGWGSLLLLCCVLLSLSPGTGPEAYR